jgi:hypothetical protein
MLPSQFRSAASAERGRAAAAMLSVCCALLAGCETAPAPVSERKVEEYRKTAPTPSAASSRHQWWRQCLPAPPAATTAAPKSAASSRTRHLRRANTATATPPPATTTAKPARRPSGPGPGDRPNAGAGAPSPRVAPRRGGCQEEATRAPSSTSDAAILCSIALDNGLDYKGWPRGTSSMMLVIRVGQRRLRAPAGWKPEAGDADGVVVCPATNPRR